MPNIDVTSIRPSVRLSICDLTSATKPFVGLSVYGVLHWRFLQKFLQHKQILWKTGALTIVQHARILWKQIHWHLSSMHEFFGNQCIDICPACTGFVKSGAFLFAQHTRILWKPVHWNLSSVHQFHENRCTDICTTCKNFMKTAALTFVQHARILWKSVHWHLYSILEFYENRCIHICTACTNFMKTGPLPFVQHARILWKSVHWHLSSMREFCESHCTDSHTTVILHVTSIFLDVWKKFDTEIPHMTALIDTWFLSKSTHWKPYFA
jgi:hypothetical protein